MSRHPTRSTASTVVVVVMCAVAEVALLGWWAVTRSTVVYLLLQLVLIVVVWLGVMIVRHRLHRHEYEEAIAANAVLADRARLADELHDTLGHDLSLIALKAGSLQVRADGSVRDLAAGIRHDVDLAVERLRRALDDTRAADSAESVDGMIERLTAAGVSITRTGHLPQGLPREVELAASQLVREGLTNALRHAPGKPIGITYRTTPADVEIEIHNPMPGAPDRESRSPTSGTGLDRLRRRLDVLGGDFQITDDSGGFTITGRLPRRVRPGSSRDSLPRTSPWRKTIRSALIPVAATVAIALGFYAWAVNDSVAEEDSFAGLQVGMSDADAARSLPAREAPVRLVPSPPHDSRWVCEYYTDGNFPLGLAVFEVCFEAGSIVRLTDLRASPWL
ncbi:sensor histidine kinase [Microbacterium sp.]|uniref:sensor histidine kinase n=1 Tax=Microbacterium sp. TaxID=51671 RepID=UPI0039E4DE04